MTKEQLAEIIVEELSRYDAIKGFNVESDSDYSHIIVFLEGEKKLWIAIDDPLR